MFLPDKNCIILAGMIYTSYGKASHVQKADGLDFQASQTLTFCEWSPAFSQKFSVATWKNNWIFNIAFLFSNIKYSLSTCMKFFTLKPDESQGFHFNGEKASFVTIHNLYEMVRKWNCKTSCKIYSVVNTCRSTMPYDNEATSSLLFY